MEGWMYQRNAAEDVSRWNEGSSGWTLEILMFINGWKQLGGEKAANGVSRWMKGLQDEL